MLGVDLRRSDGDDYCGSISGERLEVIQQQRVAPVPYLVG
jgi:hypothetical protein